LSQDPVGSRVRAIRFEADGTIRFTDVARPDPGPDEVLVQVLAAGVCRTDLHLLHEVQSGRRDPLVPGHEIAGRITQVGREVFMGSPGDVVGVHYEQPCGWCRHCRRKRTNLCQRGRSLGFDAQGGYAEFVVARQSTVLPLPPDLDPVDAATLGCSGATAYHVVATLGEAEEDSTVVVVGAGGVGLAAIQVARAQQARVLAIDPREAARKAALDAGATAAAAPDEAARALREMAGEEGADVVADFVGTRESLERGRALLGYGGRLVVVAEGEGTQDPMPVTAANLVEGGRAYLGSYSSTIADFARAIALAESGLLRPLVTRREPLSKAPSVLGDLEAGKIIGRAVLLPGTP